MSQGMSIKTDKELIQKNEIKISDPYELRQYLRLVVRKSCDLTDKFLLQQRLMTLDDYHQYEIEIINNFNQIKEIFPLLDQEYHFLLQYQTEKFLNILQNMLLCPYLVQKASFELYETIMIVRVMLSSINKKWIQQMKNDKSSETNQEVLIINDLPKLIVNEGDVLIKQMHIRTFVNCITIQLDQFFELTTSEDISYVKQKAAELNFLSKLHLFYRYIRIMLKENHFLLLYLLEKLRISIQISLSCEKFRLRTSNETLQMLAFLSSIITFT